MPLNDRRKRADGSAIDPVKDLADFVQSFPQTGQPDPPDPIPSPPVTAATAPASQSAATEAAPAPAAAPPAPEPVDELLSKTPQELAALLHQERTQRQQLEQRTQQSQSELQQERQQRNIEQTARRTFDEQQAIRERAQRVPQPAPVDPRLARIDDLWFSDPTQAKQLLLDVQRDQLNTTLQQERTRLKQEVFAELDTKRNRDQGTEAFTTSMQRLRESGVPEQQLTPDRITAVYTVITRPPTQQLPNQYYLDGGPLNPDVVVRAYRDLFGTATAPTTAPAAAPASAPAATPPVPIPAAPPGSSRPAPAASAPSQQRAIPIDSNMKKDIEYMAEQFGMNPEKLINRRRERLRKQQEDEHQ